MQSLWKAAARGYRARHLNSITLRDAAVLEAATLQDNTCWSSICTSLHSSPIHTLPSSAGHQQQAGGLFLKQGFSSAAIDPTTQGKRRRMGWLLLLPSAFAGFLGTWQVNRRRSKLEQMVARDTAFEAEPIRLLQQPGALPEYARVVVEGEFLHDRSIFIGPRPRSGSMGGTIPGYLLVTPMVSEQWGTAALVMRGWVPETWRIDPAAREPYQPAGQAIWEAVFDTGVDNDVSDTAFLACSALYFVKSPCVRCASMALCLSVCTSGHLPSRHTQQQVQVAAIRRVSEQPSSFVPANNPQQGSWFWVDAPALAAACRLPADTPLVEAVKTGSDAESAKGAVPTSMDILALRTQGPGTEQPAALPIMRSPGDLLTAKVTPQDHANYALTWYSLSAATAALALRILRNPGVRA